MRLIGLLGCAENKCVGLGPAVCEGGHVSVRSAGAGSVGRRGRAGL